MLIQLLASCEKNNPNDWCGNYRELEFSKGDNISETYLKVHSGVVKVEYHCNNNIYIVAMSNDIVLNGAIGVESIFIKNIGDKIMIVKNNQ